MTTLGYKADRRLMYEAVKFWKNSPLFSAENAQFEGEQVSLAPWLSEAPTTPTKAPMATCWANSDDVCDGAQFEDVSAEVTADDVAEVVSYLTQRGDESILESILELLEENEGRVLYIGRGYGEEAFAIQFSEGHYFVAEMQLPEGALIDEGLISMTLLAQTVPDQAAPVVPGFAPIEQKLYEALHAVTVIGQSLFETAGAADLLESIELFTEDLVTIMVEMLADEGSLSSKEGQLVVETFLGAYAGIVAEARKFAV